jgi:hypothetical protein
VETGREPVPGSRVDQPDDVVETPAEQRRRPVPVRPLAGMAAAVGCAGTALLVARWHWPEYFFQFNARSIPWAYMWSLALLSAALFAVAAVLLRGSLAASAWVGVSLLALSATGLVESFWFAYQVLQGDGATSVLPYARGYVVVLAVAAVLTWASVLLSRRHRSPPP